MTGSRPGQTRLWVRRERGEWSRDVVDNILLDSVLVWVISSLLFPHTLSTLSPTLLPSFFPLLLSFLFSSLPHPLSPSFPLSPSLSLPPSLLSIHRTCCKSLPGRSGTQHRLTLSNCHNLQTLPPEHKRSQKNSLPNSAITIMSLQHHTWN